jgi:hypothetical protein
MDPVRQIADTVLYEGYILWPYRRSAMKNRQRWTFGGVYPRAHSEARDDDPWCMRTECLLEASDDAVLDVRVRFLQVVERQLLEESDGGLRRVDELVVDGQSRLSWEEAREREVVGPGLRPGALESRHAIEIDIQAATEHEELVDSTGARVGAVARSSRALHGTVEVSSARRGADLWRITVRVSNTSPWHGGDRESALAQTFASTHTALHAEGGRFVSLTDPPEHLREEAEACRNEGTWPVLVGEAGERTTVLSSPIILEDYPRVAPESPGDLFDGGEIDQLLTLSILSMTDDEKREMRATDPRAREILERTEALSPEELMRLHGTIREFQAVRR